jgi:DNA-binding transcriptional LysR family regulator
MFLRQFHYLVSLEQEEHFGRAARRCNVSQPSLSSAIKQLEEELEIPIVLRHQRFQGFTDEGRRVLEWAKRILADRDAMIEELAIMHRNLHGNLRIAAMPMSSPVVPVINHLFSQQHPAVQIDIRFVGIDQLKTGLANFEFDAGVTYLDHQPLGRLKSLPLYEGEMSLLVPDNGWLGDRTSVTWSEAAELPLCLLHSVTHERQIVDEAFASAGCKPRPRVEADSMINLAFHVMQGELATVIPAHFVTLIGAFAGTRQVRLVEPEISQRVGLIWAGGNPMLPMTKALVDILQEAVDSGDLARRLAEKKEP